MENWRFGDITEDKKLPVRFLDVNGDPFPLSSLVGYGVRLIGANGTVLLKAGVNLTGYNSALVTAKDEYTIYVTIHGDDMPKVAQYISGSTIIVVSDSDMPDGTFTDISDDTKIIYNMIEERNGRI